MSKKRRKKSPKFLVRATLRAALRTSAKKKSSKARTPSVSKSSKNIKKQGRSSASKASHEGPSKALKSAGASKSVRGNAKAGSTALSTAGSGTLAAGRPALVEGAKAPAFSLPRDGGGTVSLSDYAGRKLVLFFYPRADTPGCTREAMDFTRLASDFAENQTAILGVSADPIKAQEAFRDKHKLSVPLASDEHHRMLEAYGAWGEKSMYGRTFEGIIRTTVLIGTEGQILRVWRHVKVDGHPEEVLGAARAA